jgi:hypothetical protein
MAGDFDRLFGSIQFGFRRAEDGCVIQDAAEQNVIARIAACVEAGMSPNQIAAILKGGRDGR